MSLSYVVGVAFASLFAVAIVSQRLLLFKGNNNKNMAAKSTKFHQAIRTSFGVFWDSAFLFNMAVTIAVVVSMQQNSSLYNQEFTRLSASISWSIIASTWPLYASTCPHPMARWVGVWAATTASAIISSSTLVLRRLDRTEFETSCLCTYATHSNLRQMALEMSNAAPFGLQALTLLFSCVYLWKAIWDLVRRKWAKKKSATAWPLLSNRDNIWRRRWRIACATIWCVLLYLLMIVSLISFALKREMTAEMAGPSLEESKWGFGQVMALATWLPTVADFVLIIKGKWFCYTYVAWS